MSEPILQLFPSPHRTLQLRGLYLAEPLLPPGWPEDRPFVYSNYVTSLDGRIAISGESGQPEVPRVTANSRDWRLFQELAAHADLLITSGRYLREFAEGKAQDALPVGGAPEFADLHRWRLTRGLRPQPDVLVFSRSLDFPIPAEFTNQGRRIWILTQDEIAQDDVLRLRQQGAAPLNIDRGEGALGPDLLQWIRQQGYRRIYCVAGPRVLHILVRERMLDALFLTTVHRLLGDSPATTILEGPALSEPYDFDLTHLYFDAHAHEKNLGQCLARYDRRR